MGRRQRTNQAHQSKGTKIRNAIIILVIGVIFISVGIVLRMFLFDDVGKIRDVLENGNQTTARVEWVSFTGTTVNEQERWHLFVNFEDSAGNTHNNNRLLGSFSQNELRNMGAIGPGFGNPQTLIIVGATIQIRYINEAAVYINYSSSFIERMVPFIFIGVGGISVLIAVITFVMAIVHKPKTIPTAEEQMKEFNRDRFS